MDPREPSADGPIEKRPDARSVGNCAQISPNIDHASAPPLRSLLTDVPGRSHDQGQLRTPGRNVRIPPATAIATLHC
jgi:hypothetical protein